MTVLVIGAAKSGIAVSRLLVRHGKEVILTDSKPIAEKEQLQNEGILVYDGGHPDHLKRTDYEYVVKNPGIPPRVP
ncbi:MAG: UDP-N-acetylmuramoyl-L-alanine--D-glutamate ligase, partial [Erysipelotrichaceae bacterium]|nr:UDP-N-acetylmuramoyl-L-alanine--D-glutamate ligase [Erysipelotrichaceae bacterium]